MLTRKTTTTVGIVYHWKCSCTQWAYLADFEDPANAKGKTERLKDIERIRLEEAKTARLARAKRDINNMVEDHQCPVKD